MISLCVQQTSHCLTETRALSSACSVLARVVNAAGSFKHKHFLSEHFIDSSVSSWVPSNKFGMLLSCGDVAVTAGWFKKEELCDHRNVAVKIKKEQNELLQRDTAELWFVCSGALNQETPLLMNAARLLLPLTSAAGRCESRMFHVFGGICPFLHLLAATQLSGFYIWCWTEQEIRKAADIQIHLLQRTVLTQHQLTTEVWSEHCTNQKQVI